MNKNSRKSSDSPGKFNLDKWIKVIGEYKELDKSLLSKTTYAEMGDKKRKDPLILMFSSDWHLGSKSCDHQQWLEDMKYLMSVPSKDVRLFLLGDLIDNVNPRFKSAEAVFGYLRPELQREMLIEILNQLKPYLEAACWGNHDVEWDEKRDGFSDIARILRNACTYFHGAGLVDYHVGNQVYKINLSHKMKGHSWFHALHGNLRGWLQTHADVVVSAHGHEWAYLSDCRGVGPRGIPVDRHLLQIGSYKVDGDTYSERYFRPGVIHNDCLVMYPDEHRIMHFNTLNDAVKWTGIKLDIPKKVRRR